MGNRCRLMMAICHGNSGRYGYPGLREHNPPTFPITQRSRRTYNCGVKQPPHCQMTTHKQDPSIQNLRGFYLELFATGNPLSETYEITLEENIQNECRRWKLRRVRYSVTCIYYGHDRILVNVKSKPQPPINVSKEGTYIASGSISTDRKGVFNKSRGCKSIDTTYLKCGPHEHGTTVSRTPAPTVKSITSTLKSWSEYLTGSTTKGPQSTKSTDVTNLVTQILRNETTKPLVPILIAVLIFVCIIISAIAFCKIRNIHPCKKDQTDSYSLGFENNCIRNHMNIKESIRNSTTTNRIIPGNNCQETSRNQDYDGREMRISERTDGCQYCEAVCTKTLDIPQRRTVQFVNRCEAEDTDSSGIPDFYLPCGNSPTGSVTSSTLASEILKLNFPECRMQHMNEQSFMRESIDKNKSAQCRCNVDSGFSEISSYDF
ncbi:hypothetical protein FSP39_021743 [Pinctada imbricata]|uniref:Uncharacterized protein n=1 Tax=Pinctada imbricata TaxID=66713 RepID=A0AA89C0S7_PINIB|nr:hypothetical protein FSP39_021743 [Pinctada imbricata]